MVITKSVRIAPGEYLIPGGPGPIITVRGSDITVDFKGVVLRGIAATSDPDLATGVAIRVEGGSNVRVVNAKVHGYMIGLHATGVRNLSLIDNDFSYNWKPRLYSVIEHESLHDWLSHHKNDRDEWMRFGAGIYLSDVRGGEVRGNRIEQGMEALMMTRTDSMLIWNNTFEYNSGVGIGMYRSSYNRIMHNHVNYNVRGYSRYYRRGQDSSDLLMYEQSSHNIVAYNWMTHGGDGVFLWAGQSTMDTGQGGANDNIFYANDFSYAPANAIEATFSRNVFDSNIASYSDYGLWGGYSFDSKITRNDFYGNRTGIAIEHGQNNEIRGNAISYSTTGINLWANKIEPSDWGYPKFRDTRSRGYQIADNNISEISRVGIRLSNTRASNVARNKLSWMKFVDSAIVKLDSSSLTLEADNTVSARPEGDGGGYMGHDPPEPRLVQELPGGFAGPVASGMARFRTPRTFVEPDQRTRFERDAIIVDEWGPYSYTYPRLWPVDTMRAQPVRLVVLGPDGTWTTTALRNVRSVSRRSGTTKLAAAQRGRDTLIVVPKPGSETDWEVVLEFRGGSAITDARGVTYAPKKPYRFTYGRFEPIREWDVSFFAWPDSADPRTKPDAFAELLRSTPILSRREPRLDYMFYGAGVKGVPQDRWAAVATTTVTLPPGAYTLRLLSDDGARVFVDGKLLIDNMAPHETAVANAPVAPGRHDIRVEYYQIGGWSELRVDIVKGTQRSAGSPGPH